MRNPKKILRFLKKKFRNQDYYGHGNILIKEKRIIYFPVAKVACSSIKKIFADILGLRPDPDDLDDSVHELTFPFVKRSHLADSAYDSYMKFAFVRNPWDRLYSCFKSKVLPDPGMYIRGFTDGVFDGFIKFGPDMRAGMSFERFVDMVADIPDNDADEHFRSQYVMLVNDDGKLLTNYLGRFEDIDKDFSGVRDWLKMDVALPKLMASEHKPYEKAYNPRMIATVEKRFQKDIELFEYDFFSGRIKGK